MKMRPNTKYQIRPQPRASPSRAKQAIPLPALMDDLDRANALMVQSAKSLHQASDIIFDLARKISIINQEQNGKV